MIIEIGEQLSKAITVVGFCVTMILIFYFTPKR